jgi:hypothetical protein
MSSFQTPQTCTAEEPRRCDLGRAAELLALATTVLATLATTIACNSAPTGAAAPNMGLQPVKNGELSAIAAGRTDKGIPGHGYTDIYEGFLVQWRYAPLRIMEIGVAGGGSLGLWYNYFPQASIFGIDIDDASRFENARVKTCRADQSKRDQLEKCLKQFGGSFDLLIDDGGHSMDQQQISLGYLFPHVRPNGFYFLEDLHTSLPEVYPGFGVEPGEANTTLTMLARYLHGVPAHFESKYMTDGERSYLDAHVEYISLNFLNNQSHSIMCVLKKTAQP